MGLDFRESALLMNTKNPHKFAPNMIFNLAIGFHDLPLDEIDKVDAKGSVKQLSSYSMLIADTVMIRVHSVAPNNRICYIVLVRLTVNHQKSLPNILQNGETFRILLMRIMMMSILLEITKVHHEYFLKSSLLET